MIRRIRLQHWRAYDHLDLALTHPVTFLVAPNGVGKSSLVEAVRWGLLGTPVDRARGRAVRGGHETASVTVLVSLPDHADIEVTRTVRRNGAATFAAAVDGRSMSEADYEATLTKAWAADTDLLDAIIFGPPTGGGVTGFPVRDHLAAVFGVDPLLRAADEIKARRDTIATQIKALRADLSGTAEAIAQADRAVAEMEAAVTSAERERQAAEVVVGELDTAGTWATAWQQYRAAAEDYHARTQALMASMADTVAVAGENPRESLAATQREATAALEASIAAATDAQVRAARAAGAAELLSAATDRCPTCLRPLSEHERDTALAAHGEGTVGARDHLALYEQQTARARQQLTAIARFSDAFAQLHPPVEPSHPDPGPQAITAVSDARARASDLAQVHGGLLARLDTMRNQLEDLRRAAADQAKLTHLATQDQLLEVVQRSVSQVADRYLTERVEPLATEIGHRWKLMFGTGGLQFDHAGQLHLGQADIDLALSDFSGGERATALLVTRVMLAASATHASTLWFDEPLEHLDPVRRASVAQTLVRAAQAGTVDQILITTYEEGLARRLEATAPEHVQLTYIRSTTPSESA